MSKKIVFFGTEDFSLGALQALVAADFTVAAVVTKPDSPQGRGQKLTPPKVKVYAQEHDIPVLQPHKLSEIIDDIAALENPVGVLLSFGKIIPQAIIDLFTPGIINVHPSLLPKYRGPSPIEAAILNGDTLTGVSIMQLAAKMDAGPIYSHETYPLQGNEEAPQLLDTLGVIGIDMLIRELPAIVNGNLLPVAQVDEQASYCSLISKADAVLDWQKPAAQLEREVRAYTGWPLCRTTLHGIDVIVTKAHVEAGDSKSGEVTVDAQSLMVGTADGLLSLDTIKPVGKKEMPVQAFLAGYRSQLEA